MFRKIQDKLYSLRDEWKYDFYDCIRDIAEHPVVLRMKLYPHHGTTNCYQHCVHVAYYNYQWCRFFHLDARSAARGAMLHDLFLYDWHTHAKKTGDHFHGLTHPKTALKNASKFLRLKKILSIIICGRLLFLEYQKQRKGLLRLLPTNIAGHARQVKEDDDERIGEKRFPYPFFGIYVEQFLEGATVSDKFSTFHML